MPDEPLFKIVETDRMTGADRYLDNMSTSSWTGTFTQEQAEKSVEWRKKNLTGRYAYTIVPLMAHMTDNAAARSRHHDRHGQFEMEECGDRDCREAAIRLMHEELNARYAKPETETPEA